MNTQQLIDSLNATQNAALLAFRDEITAANTTAMEALRASLEGELKTRADRITDLEAEVQSTVETKDADHKAATDALKAAHATEIATLQNLPAPDSVECEAIQMALVYFGGSVLAVDQVIATLPSPNREIAAIRWGNLAGGIRRGHTFVSLISQGLQFSDEKIDGLFALGRKLQADKDYTPTAEDIAPKDL